MKISLDQNYIDKVICLARIEKELEKVEEVLKTPSRTVEDIVKHIQLLKEKKEIIDKNELIIHAINKDTKEELTAPSDLVKCLLDYTKFHWNYNE